MELLGLVGGGEMMGRDSGLHGAFLGFEELLATIILNSPFTLTLEAVRNFDSQKPPRSRLPSIPPPSTSLTFSAPGSKSHTGTTNTVSGWSAWRYKRDVHSIHVTLPSPPPISPSPPSSSSPKDPLTPAAPKPLLRVLVEPYPSAMRNSSARRSHSAVLRPAST